MGNPLQKVIQFFSTSSSSRTISIIVIFIIAAAIPLTVMISQQQQETRQHAAITPVSYTFGDSSSVSAGSPNFDATSITGWLHRVSPGSNQIVLVNVSLKVNTVTTQAPTVNSITYGGRQLTKLGSKASDNRLLAFELWYLKNPPQGRNAVVVNVSRPSSIVAGAMTFSNVDQTNPFGQYLSYFGSGSVPPNLVYRPATQGLTVGQGDVMVDAITSYRIQRPCQYTAGPNQILTWAQGSTTTPLTGSYNQNGFSNDAAGSYARTPGYADFMQWTITNCNDSSGGNIWIYQVTALRASGSSPVSTPPPVTTPPPITSCGPSGNVVFDNKSSSMVTTPNTNLVWNHNVGEGSNRLLVVGVSRHASTTGTLSVTANGQSMTRIGNVISVGGTSAPTDNTMWYLVNPPSGLVEIRVNPGGNSLTIAGGASSWSNVDPNNPLGIPVANTGNNSNPNVSFSGVACGVNVDNLATAIANCSSAPNPDELQAKLWSEIIPGTSTGGGKGQTAGSYKQSAEQTSMWWNNACSGPWALKVAVINAPTNITTPSPTPPPDGVCTNGTVAGRVFVDNNPENRVFDSATEQGSTLADPILFNNNGGSVIPINRLGGGQYQFTASTNTNGYRLRLTAPSGYRITTPRDTSAEWEVSPNGSNLWQADYPVLRLPPCSQTYDFGINSEPAVIQGTVFVDDGRSGGIARNGIKETGEIGFNGATVRIPLGSTGITTTTNSTGFYKFASVNLQSTTVLLITPSGYELTTPQGVNAIPSSDISSENTVNFGIILTPTPDCTTGQTCTPCVGDLNTCNGTGRRDCTLTTTSTGSTNCRQITTNNLTCTGAPPNCTNGNVCVNNACVVPTGIPTGIPTGVPTAVPTVTIPPRVTITETPTGVPTPVPTIPAGNTVFALDIGLDSIGTTGDNANPGNNSGSNKNPLHPSRTIGIEVFDSSNASIANKSGTLTYQTGTGRFTGTVDMGNLASANYNVKVKSPGYLRRLIPGIQNVTGGQTFNLPAANLVTGDINGDNAINILDYNILISCSPNYNRGDHSICDQNADYKIFSDLNDDGVINEAVPSSGILEGIDFNLFIRELSVQNGD